jgi:molybdopterin synthase sulfur carrier subunit
MVQVLLFAQARQIVGSDSVDLSLADGATVGTLKEELGKQQPEIVELLLRSSIALDQQYATDEDIVVDKMEIAMIPPVSGG